jgi:hypothetical protein
MADDRFMLMDQPAPAHAPAAAANHAGQWGLAALLLGCFLILVTPILGVGIGAGAVVGAISKSVDEPALREYMSLAKLPVYCLMAAAALALTFGLLGLHAAGSRRQPAGLAVGGTIVAVIALVMQILLLVLFNRFAEDMIRERPFFHKAAFPGGHGRLSKPARAEQLSRSAPLEDAGPNA